MLARSERFPGSIHEQVHLLRLHPKLTAVPGRREEEVEPFAFYFSPRVFGDALAHAFDVDFAAQGDHVGVDRDRTARRGHGACRRLVGRYARRGIASICPHGEGTQMDGCGAVWLPV